ncbi:hypothetical protein FH593_20515 (plasmid) [Leptospira interrogans]|uniref:hypothetical protein n=1 Tax=Leptospira interrogans TaxID=173 RepID=UPI0002BF80E8|nr:hypothetical protein [Leptospira interrogans]EMN60343.1 hypothetical protein LEP1GSC092_0063 [Leptospira interrogans serovar Pyrogenes str. R168]ULG90683.1 hypothetical protein FH593_20810 [Leptospira interrogans]ULG90712.1 hypothetical protein FH593_20515 [Leptospira interrogans]UML78444.1 hypothetical protein FH583_21430 [Leptospira interrogans]
MSTETYEVPGINDIREIGKLRILLGENPFHLHFLVYASEGMDEEKGFAIVCIEYGLFSWGISVNVAKESMAEIIKSFLNTHLATQEGREYLFGELKSVSREAFWALYRQVAFLFGDPTPPELALQIKKVQEQLNQGDAAANVDKVKTLLQELQDLLREEEEQIMTHRVDMDQIKKWILTHDAPVVVL